MCDSVLAWHFSNGVCGHGDGREIKAGVVHEYTGDKPIALCTLGLHASERPIDALHYAPGNICSRVRLSGEILRGDDKLVATRREYIAVIDAEGLLRQFARLCALDVIDKWDAPDVVREYLETGDETIRSAARAAAWDAARDAARAAARGAAGDAAWAAASDAAWAAASDAAWAAASDAARSAAWAATCDAQNERLEAMLVSATKEGSDV